MSIFKKSPALDHLRALSGAGLESSLPVLRAAILELAHHVEKSEEKSATETVTPSLAWVEEFLDQIEIVCRRFGISITQPYEDGVFVLMPYSDEDMAGLRNADLGFKPDE